jgi:predicted ester cyclase
MADVKKVLVTRYFEELFNERRLDDVASIVGDDYVEHALAPFGEREPGHVNGPESLRQTVTWLVDQFPDLRMSIEAIVAEGDLVVARVESEGTNLGRLNGVLPPTGRRFRARQSHWFRVEGDRLVEHWATREDLPAMMQLGVIRPPSPPDASGMQTPQSLK